MEISYSSSKLEKQLTKPKETMKAFGVRAKKVVQRMKELQAADQLSVMKTIVGAKCHELKGNRKGKLSVVISGNYRLLFKPDHDPVPKKEDKGLDWEAVTAIKILEVRDYHNE